MRYMVYCFIVIFYCFGAFAFDDQLSPSSIEQIKQTFAGEMAAQKVTDQKKFYLYLWAGKHFGNFKEYESAKEYFSKAIEMPISEDKSFAFINLLAFVHADYIKDKNVATVTKLVAVINQAREFYQQYPQYLTKGVDQYLSFYRYHYAQIDNEKERDELLAKFKNNNDLYQFTQELERYQLLAKKDYQKLFSSFDSNLIDHQLNREKVLYDLANLYINKTKVKDLKCWQFYKTYKAVNDYTIKFCSLLSGFQASKRIDQAELKKTQALVTKQAPHYQIVLDAIKELK
jgi:hypothetical protein